MSTEPGQPSQRGLDLPETRGYRIKNALLGPPLNTAALQSERLSKVAALGVLAPDCISSSAYASEEILRILVPVVGVLAFSLVLPITGAIIGVLVLVTLSYREVVKVYTKAGGSYVVARDNFGPNVAQVSAVALLIDYSLTVAVQTAAGTSALVSVWPVTLEPYQTVISVAVVVVLCYGNLRGLREASKAFAVPTYFFVFALGAVVIAGLVRAGLGDLQAMPVQVHGAVSLLAGHHPGTGIFEGAGLFYILQAYANGGSALTGLEAISNGVAAFRPPEGLNARRVLVVMSCILGSLVLGVSILARLTHAIPFVNGVPTVISQEAKEVLGGGAGTAGYYVFQLATIMILWTGANTSFNGFPFLANFVAGDSFLPRQLTKRGHRLVFSNGILVLAVVGIVLLVVTNSNVDALIALYAIGVFVGFTMAGAGMARYHLRHREPRWRPKLVINSSAAVVSGAVVVIFAVTKFTQGAWVVVVAFPILMWGLIRLNRQYRREAELLETGAVRAAEAPALDRLVVLVLVDRLDLAAARAIQYARALRPDEIRAVHFVLDDRLTDELRRTWPQLGIPEEITLELRDCSDRRLVRGALELAAETLEGGDTEVSVLLPRRAYSRAWSRLLHDRTADRLAAQISRLPHANATIVPFQVGAEPLISEVPGAQRPPITAQQPPASERGAAEPGAALGHEPPVAGPAEPGTVPIGGVRWRQRAKVSGRVRAVHVQPGGDMPRLTVTLVDSTGSITLVFGRREVAGVATGARMTAEGMVSQLAGRPAIFNPLVVLLADPAAPGANHPDHAPGEE